MLEHHHDATFAACRFASMIGTREHADYMWRITKDENQHTHIAQEDIAG